MNGLHQGLLKVTGGRLGWKAGRMPVVELTTTGRKSGQRRTVLLTSPVQDGSTIVIVASKGGEPTHPAWYLNIEANPEVEVKMGRNAPQPMKARVATADERARLWPQVTATYKGYAGYQKKTTREIPLVLLEPASSS
jgi:deazaflavin-dependent oxidoreductase (nitroreductase family)